MEMAIDIERTDNGELTTLHVKGKLDETTFRDFEPFTDAIVEQRRMKVTVDLAGLDLIDSSGVAAIVGLYKRVRQIGGHVDIAGIRDQPAAIFKLLRMDKVFDDQH